MKSQSTIKSEVSQDLAQLAKDSETKHTPTPWHVGIGGSGSLCIFADAKHRQPSQIAAGNNAACICKLALKENTTLTDYFNAAFIVRACNEHAALVAVAEAADILRDSFAHEPARQRLESALDNLAAVGSIQPPITAAEHNAFPKGRW